LCGQLFEFAADSSGSVNGVAFTWSLSAEGEVVINFHSNEGSIVLAKLRDHGGSVIEVIAKAEDAATEFTTSFYSVAVKQDAATVASVMADGGFIDQYLGNGFSLTSKLMAKRADGLPSETFGFRLSETGDLGNFNTTGLGALEATRYRGGNWSQQNDKISMSFCVFSSSYPISSSFAYPDCGQDVETYYGLYRFERDWQLMNVMPGSSDNLSRYYVIETLRLLRAAELGADFEVDWEASRVNFYESISDFDLNDVDSDGYANSEDNEPLNPDVQ